MSNTTPTDTPDGENRDLKLALKTFNAKTQTWKK